MTHAHSVFSAILLLVAGAVVVLPFGRRKTLAGWIAFGFVLAAAVLVARAAASVIIAGPGEPEVLRAFAAAGSSLRLHVDGLSAFFLLLVALISVLAGFYSISYMHHYRDYGCGGYYANVLLFIAGMYGIVTTTDLMLVFFLFWQLMTIPSFLLVRYEYRKPENVRAANRYLVMMEIACALVMAGAWMLAPEAGGEAARFDFDTIQAHMPAALTGAPVVASLALVAFLAGFGIKAGLWPFGQMWLPDAHPAAPSPVSALLSGVMIKTGVYGLMRTFLWMIPSAALADYAAAAWGAAIAALGTITLFVGTMQALRQEQTKRLLAFHSIGQVGYILLGLGACLSLMPSGVRVVTPFAAVALCGALFHTLNHALFKSLLFLNAGAVLKATGTQDLNRLGGLMRFMPLTAVTALIASFSIAGVPLTNGFVSKWFIYVAAILGTKSAPLLALCGLAALLTSVLTLASFMKFFGVVFLSRTSATVEASARGKETLEGCRFLSAPQAVLAILCLLFGLMPDAGVRLVELALIQSPQGLGEILAVQPLAAGDTGLSIASGAAVFQPFVLLGALLAFFALAAAVVRSGAAKSRAAEPWLCGYAKETDAHRYGAHNLYHEFKKVFAWIGGAPHHESERKES